MAKAQQPYTIFEDVDVECPNPQGGTVTVSFAKGTHSPKNEGEEVALEAAVASGYGARPGQAKPAIAQEAEKE